MINDQRVNSLGDGLRLFEKGNQLTAIANRQKYVTKVLERSLIQDDGKRLRAGIEALMDAFGRGEQWAINLVWDRLEGKPAPQVATDDEGKPVFSGIQMIVVRADQLPAQNVNQIKDITHDMP